ncbi:MAG: hypothetical protein ACTS73_02395 [Arsenophonus sp. NEOnobi-MAG3]
MPLLINPLILLARFFSEVSSCSDEEAGERLKNCWYSRISRQNTGGVNKNDESN